MYIYIYIYIYAVSRVEIDKDIFARVLLHNRDGAGSAGPETFF